MRKFGKQKKQNFFLKRIIREDIRSLVGSFWFRQRLEHFEIQLNLKGVQTSRLENIFKKKKTRHPMKHTPFDNYKAKRGEERLKIRSWKVGVLLTLSGKELMQQRLARFERCRLCNVRAKFSFIQGQPEPVKISGKLETGRGGGGKSIGKDKS